LFVNYTHAEHSLEVDDFVVVFDRHGLRRALGHDQESVGKQFELVVLVRVVLVEVLQVVHPFVQHFLGPGAAGHEQVVHRVQVDKRQHRHAFALGLLAVLLPQLPQLVRHQLDLFGWHALGQFCRIAGAEHVDGLGQL